MVRARTRRLPLNADINVVSLIDVILLLLLIFMITAPMMTAGIDLQLPTANVQTLESKDVIMVEITSDATIHVDRKVWTQDQLETGFKTYLRGRSDVTLRADRRVDFGVVYKVMTVLNAAGVKGFGIAGQQEPIVR